MKGPCTMRLSHLVSQYTLLENFSCLCGYHGITTPGAYTYLQHKYMQSRQRIYQRDVCEHKSQQLHPNRELPQHSLPLGDPRVVSRRRSNNPTSWWADTAYPDDSWANPTVPYVNKLVLCWLLFIEHPFLSVRLLFWIYLDTMAAVIPTDQVIWYSIICNPRIATGFSNLPNFDTLVSSANFALRDRVCRQVSLAPVDSIR